MSPLLSDERRALLDLARRALSEFVLHERIIDVPSAQGRLAEPAGVFVTLHSHGRLRGCLGQLDMQTSLVEAVLRCAIAVSKDDPRFDPVQAEELPDLEFEISVLSSLKPVTPEEVVAGQHGLMVRRGLYRGLLLPQVATEYRWSRQRFLEETCVKAGLPRDAWMDPDTRIEAFTAEVFSEVEFRQPRHAQAG